MKLLHINMEKMSIVRRVALAAFCVAVMATPALAADMVQIPHNPELYESTPEALVPAQCGQCHPRHFDNLQKNGLKHQFACQNCHTKFHAYNPLKGNYADLMPKCTNCHLTLPHGDKFTDCLKCHSNPHTPRIVAFNDYLKSQCGICHSGPGDMLAQFPSKHTEQGCTACHTKHGLIPTCFDCHEPHVEGQVFEDCLTCHNPHKPLEIMFHGEDTKVNTCQSCHEDVYEKWSTTEAKHGQVSCARCHVKHGQIPQCQRCHDYPHGEAIHKQVPRCLDCHLDVHNLPVRPGVK